MMLIAIVVRPAMDSDLFLLSRTREQAASKRVHSSRYLSPSARSWARTPARGGDVAYAPRFDG